MKWFSKKKSDISRNKPVILNDNESDSLDYWVMDLPDKYKNKDMWFKFNRESGIGVGITAKCGNKECDITDYSNW